jgi:hypothetical protein
VGGGVGEEGLGIELVQMTNTNPSTFFLSLGSKGQICSSKENLYKA